MESLTKYVPRQSRSYESRNVVSSPPFLKEKISTNPPLEKGGRGDFIDASIQ